jgi:arylsulfatase A-like enzyme
VNNGTVINGVDFVPTLCKLAGASLSHFSSLDGEDVSDVWLGVERKRKRACFWEWRYRVFGHPLNQPPRLAVREGDYKLLMNPGRSRIELYDITQDPSELQNLADSKPGLTERLSKRLLYWNSTLPESPIEEVAGTNRWDGPGDD